MNDTPCARRVQGLNCDPRLSFGEVSGAVEVVGAVGDDFLCGEAASGLEGGDEFPAAVGVGGEVVDRGSWPFSIS